MREFFAVLFEWFGLFPLYSREMGDHLKGWDITCTDYIGMPWYVYVGCIMLITTVFAYALQYHIIDSPRWNKVRHWWLFALIATSINFMVAFTVSFNAIQTGNYCDQFNLSVSDCIGFGFSCALWSFIFSALISSPPIFRMISTNCRQTTFWKP